MKKGAFNFSVLFAILLGSVILFLAIYGVMQIGETQRFQSDSETAKQIDVLTNPLQAGFASASVGKIEFREETRINNDCFTSGTFGENEISVQTRSGIGEEWQQAGVESSVGNKYIFSEKENEAKEFYVFSVPFELPYKIADITLLISKNYCFVNPPEDFDKSLKLYNVPLFSVVESVAACEGESVKICFENDCEGDLFVGDDYVDNKTDIVNYDKNLVYAAIISDKENYECNVKRLLKRGALISEIYSERLEFFEMRNCHSRISDQDLRVYSDLLGSGNINELGNIAGYGDTLEDKNEGSLCELW